MNHLRFYIGYNGVPLSYSIRENETPDHDIVHIDFVNQKIACTQLYREYLSADILSALNCIISFTTGNPSENGLRIH